MRAGERAGTVNKRGYVYVTVDGKSYLRPSACMVLHAMMFGRKIKLTTKIV